MIDLATGIISTVAGNGTPEGDSGNGGPGRDAAVGGPRAVAYDAGGDLFVAQVSPSRIRRIDANDGTISGFVGAGSHGFAGDGGSAESARLFFPRGLEVDRDGTVFVADSMNHRVRLVLDGVIDTIVGSGVAGFSGDGGPAELAQLSEPIAVAVDSRGGLFVADQGNRRVRRRDAETGVLTTVLSAFSGPPCGSCRPFHVEIDGRDRVFVNRERRILSLDLVTGETATIATDLGSFAVQTDEMLYAVADSGVIVAIRLGQDRDEDGVEDWLESVLGTDPDDPDSDGDGRSDAGSLMADDTASVPPTVSITTPAARLPEGFTVHVEASASDDQFVDSVEFLIGENVVATDYSEPFGFELRLPEVPAGVRETTLDLRARARDLGGNESTSDPVTITSENREAPTVAISRPLDGELVSSGTILAVSVDATDEVSVTAVRFLVDGSIWEIDESPPYAFEFTVPDDVETVRFRAEAVDNHELVGFSDVVGVTVVSDDPPPTVRLLQPVNGSQITEGNDVRFLASAHDDVRIEGVEFFANGEMLTEDRRAPFEAQWIAPAGGQQVRITAVAEDSAGQKTESDAVIVEIAADPLTVVEGRITFADGSAVADASVWLSGLTTTSGVDGRFRLDDIATLEPWIRVDAELDAETGLVVGSSAATLVIPGGTTDVGTIELRSKHALPLFSSVRLSVPDGFVRVRSADVDRDGHEDVVATGFDSDALTVFFGRGDGTMRGAATYTVVDSPSRLALGDLNHDGFVDAIVGGSRDGEMEVLRGEPGGMFSPSGVHEIGGDPTSIAIGDFDDDGSKDVAVSFSLGVSLFLNRDDGTLLPQEPIETSSRVEFLLTGDIDRDGDLDAVTLHRGAGADDGFVSVLANLGDGVFVLRSEYPVGGRPRHGVLGDIDADFDLDVIVDGDRLIRNDGTGRFGAATSLGAEATVWQSILDDVDADGDPDLVVLETDAFATSTRGLATRLNDGEGVFSASQRSSVGIPVATDLTSGDLNEDGKRDYVLGGSSRDVAVVLSREEDLRATSVVVTPQIPASAVGAGDLNNDGNADLLAAHPESSRVSILHGDGAGGYSVAQSLAARGDCIAVAKFDEDEFVDLALLTRDTPRVLLFRNGGDGTFDPTFSYALQGVPLALASGDADDDDSIDLAVRSELDAVVDDEEYFLVHASLLFNDAEGQFELFEVDPSAGCLLEAEAGGKALAIADTVVDQNPELVFTNGSTVATMEGDFGDWNAPSCNGTSADHSGVAVSVVVVDLDGDSVDDFAVLKESNAPGGDAIQILRNSGLGITEFPVEWDSLPIGDGRSDYAGLAYADLDEDGNQDLIAVNGDGFVVVARNDGSGKFGGESDVPMSYWVGKGPGSSIAFGDFDGQGGVDLALPGAAGVILVESRRRP